MADVDMDLLLAALAQLTDAVPRESLQRAIIQWAGDPSRTLAETLTQSGEVEAPLVDALQSLVAVHLEKHQGDLIKSLSAWNAEATTLGLLTEVDPILAAKTLAEPGSTTPGHSLGPTLDLTEKSVESAIGDEGELPGFTLSERFRLIRKHAKGGIGEVWLAEDRELQREVAVKEIQARFVERKDQRKRFLLEAEITGSLEHPGIVPVYSLGRNDQGRPYYAMRFIRGESLSAAIRRFHQERQEAVKGKQGASPWGVEFQQLLRRFLDVCDAMEYAHSRRVIHRDLKPANIMLGEYGETLVVDWGLAKVLGRPPVADDSSNGRPESDFDSPSAEETAAVSGETQPGFSIGTPSYMSPEQARGEVEALGPASDVYSLGATLYELLAGIPPFAAEGALETINRVKNGALIPPRSLVSSIPAPLEAICLKAMSFDPSSRYQSARELALELEHWMADEPVAAYPENRWQKTSRWLRRHRSWTYAGAASLMGITLVATAAVFWVDGARRREEAARRSSESNFKMAQKAVDEYLTRVSEDTLLNEGENADLRKLRQDLLTLALPFYHEFVQQSREDPALRGQLANEYYHLGAITEVIDTKERALGFYRSALEQLEELVGTNPGSVEFRTRMADCYLAIGRVKRDQAHQESINWLSAALALYEELRGERPRDEALQLSIANCYSELGLAYSYDRQAKKALEALGEGRAILEELVKHDSENLELRRSLAEIVNRTGSVDYKQGNYAAALRVYQEFQQMCLEIFGRRPFARPPLRLVEALARSHFNIGAMRLERSEIPEAIKAYSEAEKTYRTLVYDHSSVTRYQRYLGETFISIATAQFRIKKTPEAMASISLARSIFDPLINAESDNLAYLTDSCMILDVEGAIYDFERRHDLAEPPFKKSLEIRRKLVERAQDQDDAIDGLCLSLTNLGECYVDQGDLDRGLPLYGEALQHRGELAAGSPGSVSPIKDFAELSLHVAEIELQGGDPEAARRICLQARAAVEERLHSEPDEPTLDELRSRLLLREVVIQFHQAPGDAAVDELRKAVDLCRQLVVATPEDAALRAVLTEALWELAKVQRDRGEGDDAGRSDRERLDLWKGRDLDPLVELARGQAVRAQVIGFGRTPLAAAGEEARQRGIERAVASLTLAFQLGFKDLPRISSDPDLAPLLSREDLKGFLADLQPREVAPQKGSTPSVEP